MVTNYRYQTCQYRLIRTLQSKHGIQHLNEIFSGKDVQEKRIVLAGDDADYFDATDSEIKTERELLKFFWFSAGAMSDTVYIQKLYAVAVVADYLFRNELFHPEGCNFVGSQVLCHEHPLTVLLDDKLNLLNFSKTTTVRTQYKLLQKIEKGTFEFTMDS